MIAYLLTDLTPAERRLVDALRSAWTCSTVQGVTGDEEADEEVLVSTASRGTRLPKPEELSTPPGRESSLLITSDTREEVRSVVRDIASAAHAGTPFHRMAVLYWQREPYASLISEQFAMADLPTAGPTAGRLAATPVGRMVKGMVDLAGGDLPRDEVTRWLTSCPVRSTTADFRPSRWDAISRDAGVVGGKEQWSERLARYAARQERTAKEQSEDLPEASRLRMEQSASEAWALRAFMLRLHDDLTPPKDGSDWRDFVEWVDGLIESGIWTPPRSLGSRETTSNCLKRASGNWRVSTTWRTALRWTVFVWRSTRRSVGPPRERARLGRGFSSGPSETRSDSGSIRSTSWAWSRASCPRESETTPCCLMTTASRRGSRSGAALLPNGTSTWPRHPPGAPPCSRSPAATTPLRGSSTRPDGSSKRHHVSTAHPSTPRCCRLPLNSLR